MFEGRSLKFLCLIGCCLVLVVLTFHWMKFTSTGSTSTVQPSIPKMAAKSPSQVEMDSIKPDVAGSSQKDSFLKVICRRREKLRKQCRTLTKARNSRSGTAYKGDKNRYQHYLIVDDKKKVMYCHIPKVACTNFNRVFLFLAGIVNNQSAVMNIPGHDVHVTYYSRLRRLESYTRTERQVRLKEYKKFLAVREPFGRFVSAYRNKFFHPNANEGKRFMKQYQTYYLKYAAVERRKHVKGIPSFPEFVTFLLDATRDQVMLNEHWAPYWELCQPCVVDYDFIIKYDHLEEESNAVFRELDIDMQFPKRADTYNNSRTNDVLRSLFKQVKRDQILQLWQIVKKDADLFDYTMPDVL